MNPPLGRLTHAAEIGGRSQHLVDRVPQLGLILRIPDQSPIHAVPNVNSDSQNSRLRLAQSTRPLIVCAAWNRW